MKNLKLTILFILVTTILIGQNEKETYFSTDLSFISDAIFMGRKDSISAPYLYPSIMYHHKSGLYGQGSLSYLTKSNESRIDLYLATVGFDFTNNKFSGDFSVTKYFFNDDSYSVISEVTADISANIRYDFEFFNLSLAASNYFSNNDNSDFFLSSEVSHDILTSDNKFQLSPTFGIHLGSQNFYEEYYINNRFGNRKGSGQGSNTTTYTEVVIKESENFNLMAIELSVPMWYSENSFTVSFLPTLVFPQNEVTILNVDTTIEEDLKEVFYFMVGISYKFR